MSCARRLVAAAAYVTLTLASASAQELVKVPAPSAPLYIIAHVDIMPSQTDEGERALAAYAVAARGEPGAKRIDVVQEIFPNHFDLVELWHDQKAYDAHLSGTAWLRLRSTINAWLGSPINERVGTGIAP